MLMLNGGTWNRQFFIQVMQKWNWFDGIFKCASNAEKWNHPVLVHVYVPQAGDVFIESAIKWKYLPQ